MITLIVVKNPFEPWNGREQKNIVAGSTAKELLQTYSLPNVETLISVNGEEVAESYVTKSGDFVVICPVVGKGGKQILGIVAAIALSFAAGAVGGALAKTLATGAKVWTTASYLAAAAVMFLGNTLIGRLTAQKVDLGNYGGESNPTYSWGEIQTMQGQNNAIALTYGTVISGGQSIGKYVTTQDNQETLNWLIAAGEGPLEISDITLNDNAIENFEDVEVEIRNGTNTQSVISNFNDTYFTKPLEYQLTDNARTDEAQGNATEALIAKIEFPNGLYYANDKGGLSEAWVELFGEYRRGQDGEWIPFLFSKATNSSYVKSVKNEAPVGNYSFHAEDFTEYDQWHEPVRTYTIATLTYPDGTLLSKEVHRGTQFSLGDFSFLIPYEDDSDDGGGGGDGDGGDGDGGHGGGGGDF